MITDVLRRRKLIAWLSIDLWEEEREMEFPDLQIVDPAERVTEDNCVQIAFKLLPEGYRQALLLSVFEGYSPLQIAKEVGIEPSGISRARKRFREHYHTLSTMK